MVLRRITYYLCIAGGVLFSSFILTGPVASSFHIHLPEPQSYGLKMIEIVGVLGGLPLFSYIVYRKSANVWGKALAVMFAVFWLLALVVQMFIAWHS